MRRNRILLLLFVIIAGFVMVALPDHDVRLFSISKEHGPSALDAIGLIVMLCPYFYLVIQAWKNGDRLRKYQNLKIFRLGLFFFGLAFGLVIASVSNDYPLWWIYGVIILVAIQIPLFYITLK